MSLQSVVTGILGGGAGKLVDSLFNVVDKFVTTKEEKEQARKEIFKAITEAQANQEAELTKRLQADMMSDSWLSKNIRPLTLIFLLVTFVGLTIFKAPDPFPAICRGWGELALMFYFGSRGIEKVAEKMWPDGKK